MNFIVVGAGTIGCYVGGRLAAAGFHVHFVGRPRILERLASEGLQVSDFEGYSARLTPAQLRLAHTVAEAWPAAQTDGARTGGPTVILLCVKGGATAEAALAIGEACPPDTVVLSLQNGVDNVGRIERAAPHLQAVAGMVPYNVVALDANKVHRGTGGRLVLADTAATRVIAGALNTAGLPTVLSGDMAAVQWGKLLLNLNNPVNALSDLPLREELMDRDYRRVLAALQTEALAALRRAGISPAQISTVAPGVLPHVLRLPNFLFFRLAARMLRIDAQARSSMWEDIQHGRTTEIDDLCGAVVRLAQQHGAQAPRNAAMCRLVATHAKGVRFTGRALRQALESSSTVRPGKS